MLCAIENATVALVAQHILFASVPNERMYLHCIVRIPNGPLCNVPCEKGKFFQRVILHNFSIFHFLLQLRKISAMTLGTVVRRHRIDYLPSDAGTLDSLVSYDVFQSTSVCGD